MTRGIFIPSALMAGAGLVVMGVGAVVDAQAALFAWHFMFSMAASTTVGALVLLMISHVVDAPWLTAFRPLMQSVVSAMPMVALLFVPSLLGMHLLFPWVPPFNGMDKELIHTIEVKQAYLNVPFFVVRSALYLALWNGVALQLLRWSQRNGSSKDERKQKLFSGGALPFIALSIHFAAVDWVQSLDAAFASTMFGVYWFVGGFLAAVALVTVLGRVVPGAVHVMQSVRRHFHGAGKMQLGLTAFWAYIAFSQFFLVWIANIPEEAQWYVTRTRGLWGSVGWMLIIGHFALPLLLLLMHSINSHPSRLVWVSGWLLLMHAVDSYWLVIPAQHGVESFKLLWLHGAAVLAVVGIMTATIATSMRLAWARQELVRPD